MKPARRGSGAAAAVIIIVVLVLAAAGVAAYLLMGGTAERTTPIGSILRDLRKYDGQQVTVKGKVVARMSILTLRWYEVQDKTGSITVVTKRGLPNRDEEVTVTGTVREVFNVGGYDKTVIVEGGEPGEQSSNAGGLRERLKERFSRGGNGTSGSS